MNAARKWTLSLGLTLGGVLLVGLAWTDQVQPKLEAQKLAAAKPIAVQVPQAQEHGAAATPPLSQAEVRTFQADLARQLSLRLLEEPPYCAFRPWRSLVSAHGDHLFRGMAITRFGHHDRSEATLGLGFTSRWVPSS